MVYLVHELLHISVVWRIGDISLTHSGIFFWLNSSAKMSKIRFLLFMSMPLLILSIIPMIIALFSDGFVYRYMRYIAWINAIIAGADIINTILIIIKPRNSVFYRGFYKITKIEGEKWYRQLQVCRCKYIVKRTIMNQLNNISTPKGRKVFSRRILFFSFFILAVIALALGLVL